MNNHCFLQADVNPWQREGGLHGLLASQFPVRSNARSDQTQIDLQYACYQVEACENAHVINAIFRLTRWVSGNIEAVIEQPVLVCMLSDWGDDIFPFPSRNVNCRQTPEAIVEHISQLVHDMGKCARERCDNASQDSTPDDLVIRNQES